MKKTLTLVASILVAGSTALSASAAINPADSSNWTEDTGYSTTPPAGALELSQVFSGGYYAYDLYGRTAATAAITTNTVDATPLGSISGELWGNGDVDLFKINITDSANFSLTLTNSGSPVLTLLALFDANGRAVAASIGSVITATSNAGITSGGLATVGVTLTPGNYYVGISSFIAANPVYTAQPVNNAGAPLFDLSTAGVHAPSSLADTALGTNPLTAWVKPGAAGTTLLNAGLFTSYTLGLTGSDDAVTATAAPEPASLGALGVGAVSSLLKRKRRGGAAHT